MNQQKLAQIKNLLDSAVVNHETAGVNCLILQDGIEQYYYETGFLDVEAKTPYRRDTIARLYSMSKTITSAAVMILVERGIIDLFDNVSKYIPSFCNPVVAMPDGTLVPASREVRITDLLSMTSGITYPGDGNKAYTSSSCLMNDIIDKLHTDDALSTFDIAMEIGRNPLLFDPGSHWEYGLSADVLGAVVEVASGMKFSDFLQQNLFEPLGMNDCGFYVPNNKLDRLAKLYECNQKDFILYTYDNLGISNSLVTPPAFESGGAGLCATINDFVPFSQMLLNGGVYNNVRILSPETVRYMTSYQLNASFQNDIYTKMPHLTGYTYGNLLRVMTNSNEAVTLGCNNEYGWDGWTGTYMANDPCNRMTILMTRQKTDCGTDDLTRKLRNIVYSALD